MNSDKRLDGCSLLIIGIVVCLAGLVLALLGLFFEIPLFAKVAGIWVLQPIFTTAFSMMLWGGFYPIMYLLPLRRGTQKRRDMLFKISIVAVLVTAILCYFQPFFA